MALAGVPRGAALLLAVVLLAAVAAGAPAARAGGGGFECPRAVYLIHQDGSVDVNYTVVPAEAPANITVPLDGAPLTVEVYGPTGELLPARPGNGSVSFTVYSTDPVVVSYITLDLTSKNGTTWTLKASSPCETLLVVLPQDAVAVDAEPGGFTLVLYKGLLALQFNQGSATVNYILAPRPPGGAATTTTTTTTTTPAGAPGGQPPTTGQAQTTAGAGGTAPPPGAGETAEGGSGRAAAIAAVVVVAAVAAGLGVLYLRRRGSSKGAPPAPQAAPGTLDERDRAILEALKSGPMTASQIGEVTGIPKTPLYRRLKRLEEEGLIESYMEGGVRKYRLRGGQ